MTQVPSCAHRNRPGSRRLRLVVGLDCMAMIHSGMFRADRQAPQGLAKPKSDKTTRHLTSFRARNADHASDPVDHNGR